MKIRCYLVLIMCESSIKNIYILKLNYVNVCHLKLMSLIMSKFVFLA